MAEFAEGSHGAGEERGETDEEDGAGSMLGEHVDTDGGREDARGGDADLIEPEAEPNGFRAKVTEDDPGSLSDREMSTKWSRNRVSRQLTSATEWMSLCFIQKLPTVWFE